MFDLLKARLRHGYQAIPDVTKAVLPGNFPGYPHILKTDGEIWSAMELLCPTQAIGNGLIDLGRCVFCGECQRKYPAMLEFTNFHKTATDTRSALLIDSTKKSDTFIINSISSNADLHRIFGRSLKLRSVSAGGCAACELELNACGNVNFDMGRYGIDIVASPRHADGVIVTGPVSANMAYALEQTWKATPQPKILILAGACAISGGLFADSPAIDRSWLESIPAALYVPGCPIHPLTLINGILRLLGRG